MWFRIGLSVAMLLAITTGLATAQQMIVYPAKGQTPAQQDKDKYECSSWATQQTGFNPTIPPPVYQQSAPPPPGVFGTAARGAAVGAVGGAIGGNAGKGAAIGAGVGAVSGRMRQNANNREAAQASQQAQAQQQGAYANYEKAYATCLSGRGYSVK